MPYKFIPKTTILNNLSAFVPASKGHSLLAPRGSRRREDQFRQLFDRASTKFNGIVGRRRQNHHPANWFSLKSFPFTLREGSRPELKLSKGQMGDRPMHKGLGPSSVAT
jgi:hypothetical protein